jgi:hypothetical protein
MSRTPTWTPRCRYRPPGKYSQDFRARAQPQSEGGFRVSAALLDRDEAKQVFATDVVGSEAQVEVIPSP